MEKPLPNQQLNNSDEREKWEKDFHTNYIEPQIKNIIETSANYRMKLDAALARNQNNNNMIESEIDQTLVMDKPYRNENLPSLWRTIGIIDFDGFRAYYISEERNTNNYPFLSIFFKYAKQLELLKHLLPIVKFVQILNSKLGYYLTRRNAREMTFKEFLENESNGGGENHEIFKSAFDDFKLGWNTVLPNVRRYECHELPNQKPEMDFDCQVVLGLMEPKDAGIFLCGILKYLVELQNDFLKEVMAIPPGTCRSLKFLDEPTFVEQETGGSTKTNTPHRYYIQSMRLDHVRSVNVINFNWDDEILAYSQRNFDIAKGQRIVYDLAKIEAELANILVFNKIYI